MNKTLLLIFSLFICACIPIGYPVPNIIKLDGNSPSPQIIVSSSPQIDTSVITPVPSATDTNPNSGNPNPGQTPDTITSPNPVVITSPGASGTIKITVSINYNNSVLAANTKTVSVTIIDDKGNTSTTSIDVTGGELIIPANTRTIIFNALDFSGRVLSTITRSVDNSVTSIQFTFLSQQSSGGSNGGNSSDPIPDIPVNVIVNPDDISVK